MTQLECLDVAQLSEDKRWASVLVLGREIVQALTDAALSADDQEAVAAVRAAKGARQFLQLFEQRVQEFRFQAIPPDNTDIKQADPMAPLEIL